MSGGGIGQLINSISYDEKHEEVVILGGTNEIVYTRDPSEFVFTIDKSLEKLRKLAEEVTTSFVLPCVPLVTPEMKAKADYLEEEVRKVEKVKIIKLQDIQQEGIHPTEVGTCSMIQQLHQAFNEEIIVDGAEEGDLTTRKYGKVQAIYKVGCRGCDNHNYTSFLCTECKNSAPESNIERLLQLLKVAEEEMFPEVDGITEKRQRSDDEDGQQRKSLREA